MKHDNFLEAGHQSDGNVNPRCRLCGCYWYNCGAAWRWHYPQCTFAGERFYREHGVPLLKPTYIGDANASLP